MAVCHIEFSNPPEVARPIAAYTHVASVPPGARLLFLAGQIGISPKGHLSADANDQYRQSLSNVTAILRSQGGTPGSIVRLTTYLVQPLDQQRAAQARRDLLGGAAPPSTLVYVSRLARPDILVEIEATAALTATGGCGKE